MPERLTGPSVLALVGRERSGPDLWRVWQPIAALERRGYWCGWEFKDAALLSTIAPQFAGYVLPRISWPAAHRKVADDWFRLVRASGKFAVYEADDDVFTERETQRRVELDWTDGKSLEDLESDRQERVWAMQQCDGVTVSTQRLATIVRQFTDKPVIVVPNAIDLKWFTSVVRGSRRQIEGLTIGWAGGRRHDRDVEAMAEAWGWIARKYPAVRFVVQGWQPQVILDNVPADRLTVLPWLPPETYPVGIRQVDIGCCAVADTPFNRAKSPIKAWEYAAAGAAAVASPLLYSSVIDHGYSGLIASTAQEWTDALGLLVESHATRQMMAKRLLRTVEKRHSLEGNLPRWPEAWRTIQESAKERHGRLIVVA
jgi:glycosyltransferase involved in cell wall biosynthesis